MFVIRKKLSETEGLPDNMRWDETAEEFQISYDGGETWVDSPESDPRSNPALINPATDARCDAAQGFSNMIRLFVDSTYDAFNIVGITSAAISIGLIWLPGINLFFKIAQIVADGIVAVGAVTLAATFDEPTYDEIREIAYCHIDETGHFTEDDWNAIGEQLQTDIGGSAFNITLAAMYNLYGWVGFQNGSLDMAETASCDGDACDWEVMLDFRDEEHGFTDVVAYNGVWITGEGWRTGATDSFDGSNWGRRIYQERDLPTDTQISGFDVFIQPTTSHQMWVELYNQAYTTGGIAWTTTGSDPTGHEETSPAFTGSMGANVRHIRIFSSGFNPQNTFRYLRIRGSGTNPFV